MEANQVNLRTWHRRRDRHEIDRWPPYLPELPAHWVVSPPVSGPRVSLAITRGPVLVGRVTLRNIANGAADLGIAIHPEHLGQGLGVTSLCLLAQYARQQRLTVLRLDVAEDNRRAVRCYERAGFVVIGERWRSEFRYLDMARVI